MDIQLSEILMPTTTESEMKMVSFPMEMDREGATGALVKMRGFKAGSGSAIVYFDSEDCAIEEARIEETGDKIQQSKESIVEYAYMVLAIDIEGNLFGVHSPK